MKKVIVLGQSGAGKSTFSRRLSALTGLKVYHLDLIWWKSDKTHVSRDEFDQKLSEILKNDEYIIDGDYSRTYEVRMANADTIFFLNYPLEVCLKGVSERIGKRRDDLPWVEEELDPEFENWIKDKHSERINVLTELIKKYEGGRNVYVFKSRRETENYLDSFLKEKAKMCDNQVIGELIRANEEYVSAGKYLGDVSDKARKRTAGGQRPKAVVIACADSRVIPEAIFGAGVGELFVIRVAGNVIDLTETASVEYAVSHLGVKTVVVLGHTHCGAIGAAIHGEFGGNVGNVTRRIKDVIGEEKDDKKACRLNVLSGVETLLKVESLSDATVVGAVYDIESGKVEFI